MDYLEELAKQEQGIIELDIRQIHGLVLANIDEENKGRYRSTEVKISGSEYDPPCPTDVPIQMKDFGKWLSEVSQSHDIGAEDAILLAAVAHTWFVTIHPFVDGNGRTARLLMNLILMRFGYPIAIVTKDDRRRYYDALEESQTSDLSSFINLIVESIHESLEEYEYAFKEQKETNEWAQSITNRFNNAEEQNARNRYVIWKNAMEIIKGFYAQLVSQLSESSSFVKFYFRDFGVIEFEKFVSLSSGGSAKKTWFFRLDVRTEAKSARYLFFFARPSHEMNSFNTEVSIRISREEPEGSFHYEPLDHIDRDNVPTIREIAYSIQDETYKYRKDRLVFDTKVESLAKDFFEEVRSSHFST